MAFARTSLFLQVLSLLVLCGIVGWLLYEPAFDDSPVNGHLTVHVHRVFGGHAADSFRIEAGGLMQNLSRERTSNRTFFFPDVGYWTAVVFRVYQGPHPRASVRMLPIEFRRGPHGYRLDNQNIAFMTLNWVKEVKKNLW